MQIGNLILKNNLFFAPVAGYSDVAFRALARQYGAALCFTEMVSAKGLFYGNKNTNLLLETLNDESPKAVQLFGSVPEVFKKVVGFDEIQKFDLIDINMGCPMRKIVSNGEGSKLLDNPNLIGEIVAAAKESKKPVSVKMRIGYSYDSVLECALSAEKAGADAITVHGRRQAEFYSGVSDNSFCKMVKEEVKIPVILNGDIRTKEDYVIALNDTKADGVMIARAALGRPYIFSEILDLPFEKNIKGDILKQLEIAKNYYSERTLVGIMKKHLCLYAKNAGLPKSVNLVFNSLESLAKLYEAIEENF